jgi:hypothetical protein
MFANILQQESLADDVAGALFLMFGAIPAAFFLLLAVVSPAPTACDDASPNAASTGHALIDRQSPVNAKPL